MADTQILEQTLKAVANQRRLNILVYLKKHGTATVGQLAEKLGTKIFPMSQHLRVLRSAGIVTCKRRGRYVYYRIKLPQKQPIKQVLSLL